jgi:phospholipid/cholesterol/gamma-HCH transport system permease protein
MASGSLESASGWQLLADRAYQSIVNLGDLTLFTGRTFAWLFRRRPSAGTLLANLFAIGVGSVFVVTVTGIFLGMILALQAYQEFHKIGMATRVGAIINISMVSELGPVLAATMIAGRIGTAMAAELGTMRITEQVDALECLGANPIHYLVVPRVLACLLLVPLLTILADFAGIESGALVCVHLYQVEPHYYWTHARDHVGLWDIFSGIIKSLFFGLAIALIACHRGFNCRPGAEGVGRAATDSFVASFIAILALDLLLTPFLVHLGIFFLPATEHKLL